MTTRLTRLAAGFAAAAALTAGPLLASVALPVGLPGSPAVAVASLGPECMDDPASDACMDERRQERNERRARENEGDQKNRQNQFDEIRQRAVCAQHPTAAECPDAGKWGTGKKVLVGIGIALVLLVIGPFVVAAILAGGWTVGTIREVNAGTLDLDHDDDDDGYDAAVDRIMAQAEARAVAEAAASAPTPPAALAASTDPAAVLADLLAKRPRVQPE